MILSKYLKYKNQDIDCYDKLKAELLIKFVEKYPANYRTIFLVYVYFFKTFVPGDNLQRDDIEDYIDLALAEDSLTMDNKIVEELLDLLCSLFVSDSFAKTKGNILEYLTIQLENQNGYKLFLEPNIFFKKRNLLNRNSPYGRSYMDIFKINSFKTHVVLIECKSDINKQISHLISRRNKKFFNKLNYIDNVERKISNMIGYNSTNVVVEKKITSYHKKTIDLPNRFKDYQIISIVDLMRLNSKTLEKRYIS